MRMRSVQNNSSREKKLQMENRPLFNTMGHRPIVFHGLVVNESILSFVHSAYSSEENKFSLQNKNFSFSDMHAQK